MSERAMILMSGGPDSFAAAKWAMSAGYNTKGVFFDAEHDVAKREYEFFQAQTSYLDIDSDSIQVGETIESFDEGSTDPEHVFKGHGLNLFPFSAGITSSLAISYANTCDIETIVYGLHADDFRQSKEYSLTVLNSIFEAANQAQVDIELELPFAEYSKAEVVRRAKKWDIPLAASWSCTQLNHEHCGSCPQCAQRREALGTLAAKKITKMSQSLAI